MKKGIREAPLFLCVMILLLGLALLQCARPSLATSEIENRTLAQFQPPSAASVLSGQWMTDTESAVADQFPLRNQWMNLQACTDAVMLRNERNGILIGRDGWLFEENAHLDLRTARQNSTAVQGLAQIADAPVTLLLVPMSSAVYADALPAGYVPDDQEAILAELAALMPDVEMTGIYAVLREGSVDTTLFFRTDHHWNLAGANVACEALAQDWALPEAAEPLERETFPGGEYGSYSARAPSPWLPPDPFDLAFAKDTVLWIEGQEMGGLFDADTLAQSRDKYAQLLYGNHGHITLTSGAPGGTLVVIKDSYANMLLPLLSQYYGRIEAIDPRYYTGDLNTFLQEEEKERILCVYGLTTWLRDRNLLRHAALPGD